MKHYKLKKTAEGRHYVSHTRSFQTLTELVEHYCLQADGLCVRLGEPCKKVPGHVLFLSRFLRGSLLSSVFFFF